MVDVPVFMPVTIPVVLPMPATTVLLLIQVPPGTGLLNVVVIPTQMVAVPVIAPGMGLTVAIFVTLQPAPGV